MKNDNSLGLSMPLADPDWVLAHFTLAADLTTLREECLFARTGEMVAARYQGLPFAALAFLGLGLRKNPAQLASLAAQLVAPGEAFYLLLNGRQRSLAEQAFVVEHVQPEWQMQFTGDAPTLDPGGAVPLGQKDLRSMQALAENAGLTALETDPFRRGPAFGVWERDQLAAMAATRLLVGGAAEIGNIATRTTHRRRGLARQAIAALVQEHIAEGRRVFLIVYQTNRAAARLYEGLGFERVRPMFLLRCRLETE
ncbi:MAG: GNAT family N-acetyltransferase [Chloroflexota bacterium]|nr:GNAT family N-acetyltransferase [Chloroflexota bacterium]